LVILFRHKHQERLNAVDPAGAWISFSSSQPHQPRASGRASSDAIELNEPLLTPGIEMARATKEAKLMAHSGLNGLAAASLSDGDRRADDINEVVQMSISSISSGVSTGIQYGQEVSRQRRQDFADLANALKSNDLGGAQKAFSDLQSLAQPGSSSTATPPTGTSPVQKDFAALSQALSAGNLSQAQTDFNQMQTDFKATAGQNGGTGGVHGHHHHHHAAAAYQQQSDTGASATTAMQSAASSSLSSATSNSDSLTATLLSIAA
jgi:hypothetical protein